MTISKKPGSRRFYSGKDIFRMVELNESGISLSKIAEEYKVSPSAVRRNIKQVKSKKDFLEYKFSRFNEDLKSRGYNPWPKSKKQSFIDYFIDDTNFNRIYENWICAMKKDDPGAFLYKPSIDHIIPVCDMKKCGFEANLQCVTILENQIKNCIPPQIWFAIRPKISQYLL